MASTTAGISLKQTDLAHLEDDEEILGNITYGWLSWLWLIIIGIVTTPLLIGFVVLLHVYQAKRKSGCVVTNYRVIQTTGGLLSSETKEIRMNDIRSISTYNGFLGGGVKLDTGAGEITVGATNPQEMANVIREQKNKQDHQ